MKRQIRNGVFETNSSSTHAICITKKGYVKDDCIDFRISDFGWEFCVYNDMCSRASYLITAIFSFDKNYADEKLQQLKDILDDNHIKYVIPTPKVTSYKYREEVRYYYDINGHVDHAGEAKEFIEAVLSDSDKLFRYLFGDSMIVTGNDNSDDYCDRMYINEGTELTTWGSYPRYGSLKPEFNDYEIYEKGN